MKRAGTKTTALIIALCMLLTCCTWLSAVFGVKTARAEEAGQWTPNDKALTDTNGTVRGSFDAKTGFVDVVGQVNGQAQYTIRVDDGSDNRGPIETYPIKTWGGRVGYEAQFDFDSFEAEIDFTYLNNTPNAPKYWGTPHADGEQLNLMFSSLTPGMYFGNEGMMITIKRQVDDIKTEEDESRNYSFTVTNGGHGTSNASFKGNKEAPKAIPFAGGFSGWVVNFPTNVLSFKITSDEKNYNLTIAEVADPKNELLVTMPKTDLEKGIGEKVYMAYGGLNPGPGVVRFNKLTCDDTKAYDAAIAPMIEKIKKLETDVQTMKTKEEILATNLLRKSINLAGFRNSDVQYFQERIKAATDLFLQNCTIEGIEALVDESIPEVRQALTTTETNAHLGLVFGLYDELETYVKRGLKLDAVRGAALEAQAQTVYNEILAKVNTVVSAYIGVYENSVTAIKNLAGLQDSSAKRAEAVTYLYKLSGADREALDKRLTEADQAFAEKNAVAGWDGSSKGLMISTDSKTIRYSALAGGGMSSNVHMRDNSTVTYTDSKLAVNNFSMSFTFDKLAPASGWLSIGLMAKPNSFSTSSANDPDDGIPMVQNNPGLMFLITPYENGTATVQMFFIKLTTTDFYAALVNELSFNYEVGKPIELSVKATDNDKDSYLDISIGGTQFPKKRIDNSAITSVFGKDCGGYLNICQMNGDGSNNCYEVTFNQINGHDAASADIAKVTALPDKEVPTPTPTPDPEPTTRGCGGNVAFAGMAIFGAAIVAAAAAMIRKKRINH